MDDRVSTGEILRCDSCREPIAPGEFVGLNAIDGTERGGGRSYVVAQVGAEQGDVLDCDVYFCTSCLTTHGTKSYDG